MGLEIYSPEKKKEIRSLLMKKWSVFAIIADQKAKGFTITKSAIQRIKNDSASHPNYVPTGVRRGAKEKLSKKKITSLKQMLNNKNPKTQEELSRHFNITPKTLGRYIKQNCKKKLLKKPWAHAFNLLVKHKRSVRSLPLSKKLSEKSIEKWSPVMKHGSVVMVKVVKGTSSTANKIFKPIFVEPGAKVNQDYYMENVLKPFLDENEALFTEEGYIFHQDSAPAHVGKKTTAYLRGKNIPFFSKDEWLPASPDCAPCDYWLWGYLKNRVRKRNCTTIKQLKKAIIDEAKLIPLDMAERAMAAMPKRLIMVNKMVTKRTSVSELNSSKKTKQVKKAKQKENQAISMFKSKNAMLLQSNKELKQELNDMQLRYKKLKDTYDSLEAAYGKIANNNALLPKRRVSLEVSCERSRSDYIKKMYLNFVIANKNIPPDQMFIKKLNEYFELKACVDKVSLSKFTTDQALKLLLDLNLTQEKFKILSRNLASEHIFPSFNSVSKILKQKPPGNYEYSEFYLKQDNENSKVTGCYATDVEEILKERIDLMPPGKKRSNASRRNLNAANVQQEVTRQSQAARVKEELRKLRAQRIKDKTLIMSLSTRVKSQKKQLKERSPYKELGVSARFDRIKFWMGILKEMNAGSDLCFEARDELATRLLKGFEEEDNVRLSAEKTAEFFLSLGVSQNKFELIYQL
uniref:DDE_3 domain-containing protein n=1 Tax=Rhabditophanes sp. KR3021 TaxID=114890 RepID=A0AC35UET8_9BILA